MSEFESNDDKNNNEKYACALVDQNDNPMKKICGSENFWKQFEATPDTCVTLRKTFTFYSKPLSQEEAEYPLAYGMLVYKDIRQLLYVLAAFYHPQNAYCIAVDGRASGAFRKQIETLQSCFPNIHTFVSFYIFPLLDIGNF